MQGGAQQWRAVPRLVAAVFAVLMVGLVAAPGAQAATAGKKSLTPFVNCYWDNKNGTVTVSLGVVSTNASTVDVPVGTDNRVTMGNQDRGQPTSFLPGSRDNVWAATVTYAEISAGIDWSLTGNSTTITSAQECPAKPVPAQGNAIAVAAAGLVTTAFGALFLRRRRAHRPGS